MFTFGNKHFTFRSLFSSYFFNLFIHIVHKLQKIALFCSKIILYFSYLYTRFAKMTIFLAKIALTGFFPARVYAIKVMIQPFMHEHPEENVRMDRSKPQTDNCKADLLQKKNIYVFPYMFSEMPPSVPFERFSMISAPERHFGRYG